LEKVNWNDAKIRHDGLERTGKGDGCIGRVGGRFESEPEIRGGDSPTGV
jgi:hypothetical protein